MARRHASRPGTKRAASGARAEPKRRRLGLRMIVMSALILVSAGAIAAVGLWKPGEHRFEAPGPLDPQNPQPWQYDPVNNRHWHPDHGHWHPGPPPGGVPDLGDTPALRQSPAQPASTPAPFEYDEANDRHWDPNHRHWHQGPPPAIPGQ